MRQQWSMVDIQIKFASVRNQFEESGDATEEIYQVCLDMANRAKQGHTYRNVKGELESSVGVVVLKDRNEVVRYTYSMMASSGSDPSLGIADFRNVLTNYLVGKSELPDGTHIPSKGVVGIVFAAAPYAGIVEAKGREVLNDFAPESGYVFSIIKTALGV